MTSADPQLNGYGDIADAMLLDTVLEAGEKVRTPLIVLMQWSADSWLVAQNKWRRWMADYNLPRFGGSLPTPITPTTGGLSLFPDQSQEFSAIDSYVRRGTTEDHGASTRIGGWTPAGTPFRAGYPTVGPRIGAMVWGTGSRIQNASRTACGRHSSGPGIMG